MSTVTLTPVAKAVYWRVKIAWPNPSPHTKPRYFGKFQTKAEAQKWIERHHWMTEQRQEPDLAMSTSVSRRRSHLHDPSMECE
jgi:hypothetical protein